MVRDPWTFPASPRGAGKCLTKAAKKERWFVSPAMAQFPAESKKKKDVLVKNKDEISFFHQLDWQR